MRFAGAFAYPGVSLSSICRWRPQTNHPSPCPPRNLTEKHLTRVGLIIGWLSRAGNLPEGNRTTEVIAAKLLKIGGGIRLFSPGGGSSGMPHAHTTVSSNSLPGYLPRHRPMLRRSPQRQTPDSLMLHGFWYRALPSERVRRNRPEKADAARNPTGFRARSARSGPSHCRMPARIGACRFPADTLMARRWNATITAGASRRRTAQCQLIPSLTADQKSKVDRIYAGSYACEEQDEFCLGLHSGARPAGSGIHQTCGSGPPQSHLSQVH